MNVGPETIKLLEENTGDKLLDIGLGNDLLYLTPKAKATKAKINKQDYIKLKSFCTAKETTEKMKDIPLNGRKSLECMTDKGLIFNIYKQLIQVNIKNKQTNKQPQKLD